MSLTVVFLVGSAAAQEYRLIWSDEFDSDGEINESYWNFERGFVRNEELQWYQSSNAYCQGGVLVIEARKEDLPNPMYGDEGRRDWRTARERVTCTSASINTAGKFEFTFGRLEVRARIPVVEGAWPAIWTLGAQMEWPSNGEIDVMEFYRIDGEPVIMANAAWGTDKRWNARWKSVATPLSHFLEKDEDWAESFHVWRMDWDEDYIRLYLDDELLNEIPLSDTFNGEIGEGKNPFVLPQYILLNLAVGGKNGGPLTDESLPMRYEVDYVRVYQLQ